MPPIPKDRRKVEILISVYDFEGPLEGLEDRLGAYTQGLEIEDPHIEKANSWEDSEFVIVGTRKATPKEMERAKKASERAKHANAMKQAKKDEQERLEYERLRKKFADA